MQFPGCWCWAELALEEKSAGDCPCWTALDRASLGTLGFGWGWARGSLGGENAWVNGHGKLDWNVEAALPVSWAGG